MSIPEPNEEREFARIDVSLNARFQVLEPDSASRLLELLERKPSVWAPSQESALRNLAISGTSDREAILAQAVLDLAGQVVTLRSRLIDATGPMQSGTILELSGGGGRLSTEPLLDLDTLLELRLPSDEDGCPPVRALVRIVHRDPKPPGSYGLKFEGIHPQDQDRIIRYIYQVQRSALREQLEDDRNDK